MGKLAAVRPLWGQPPSCLKTLEKNWEVIPFYPTLEVASFSGGFMKNFRLVLVAVACLTLVAGFSLSGCSKGSSKLKISSWGSPEENQILVDLLNDFQKKHPDIPVELQRLPYNEYTTKLLTEVAGGLAPDVVFTEVGNFADLFLRGALEPLNPYVQADHMDLSGYYPQVVDRFSVDGQIY